MIENEQIKKKLITISCPVCGMQYLPAEIFIPDNFVGKPSNIEKTISGKVDLFDGTTMDLQEDYTCDRCNSRFKVIANVSFRSVEYDGKNKFEETYSHPITQRVSLFEDI